MTAVAYFKVAFPHVSKILAAKANDRNVIVQVTLDVWKWTHHPDAKGRGTRKGNESSDFLRWVAINILPFPTYAMETAGINYRDIARQFVILVPPPSPSPRSEVNIDVRVRIDEVITR